MKLELSDGMSNNSDFSNDSQNSQMSTADFMTSMGNGVLLTPTTTPYMRKVQGGKRRKVHSALCIKSCICNRAIPVVLLTSCGEEIKSVVNILTF
ncbi:hypothetical protein TcasGA2_TC034417 [Tribolium castaneum]|uniref:Uncharacterized protein n=1 Tax=Tribolium castaneum TaxID=7070 RepID=A0A139WBK9_TRICA|nr:hypothetical protein TcasGA2_TC034417 [Tribolium castaneum]